jgi:hypothetical protein
MGSTTRGALAIIFVLASASAALECEGRAVNSRGQPIVGAEVTILGRVGTVHTDRSGRFTFVPDHGQQARRERMIGVKP